MMHGDAWAQRVGPTWMDLHQKRLIDLLCHAGVVFGEIAVAGEASIFELLKIRHELVGGRSGSGFPQRKAVGIESGNGKSIVVVRSSVSLEISSN